MTQIAGRLLIIILLVLAPCILWFGIRAIRGTPSEMNVVQLSAGALTVEGEPQVELGSFISGETIGYLFRVKNSGETDCVITNVRTSCGCMSVSSNMRGRTITPGETIDFPVALDTRNRSGSISGTVNSSWISRSSANDGFEQRGGLSLRVSCEVQNSLTFSPEQLDMGTIMSISDSVKEFQVVRNDGGSVDDIELECNGDFTVVAREKVRLDDGIERIVCRVKLSDAAFGRQGSFSGVIRAKSKDVRDEDTFQDFYVTAFIAPDLTVVPKNLLIQASKNKHGNLQLVCSEAIEIESVQLSNEIAHLLTVSRSTGSFLQFELLREEVDQQNRHVSGEVVIHYRNLGKLDVGSETCVVKALLIF